MVFAFVGCGAYFANVELQSYWGRRVFEGTGLEASSLPEAIAKANREKKLVLVDVSAIWCENCRRLDIEVF